jgi:hypothetical protein
MQFPFEFDVHATYWRDERLREADAERLARLAQPHRLGVRSRLALTLHALANWVDCCPAPQHTLETAYGRVSST